ncbi:MAG: hypothetical protein HYV18_03485 [Gammaproteobacteria bacterium]|nr:hypothetical protein [Gammaproteobacteria bacterium]
MTRIGMRDGLSVDERRRRLLVRALGLGVFAGGLGWRPAAYGAPFGRRPEKLPEGRSVFELRGAVTVNGRAATAASAIRASDTIRVGADSYLIAAVGDGAFLVRENSVLELGGENLLVRSMRLLSGAVLAVFGKRGPAEAVGMSTPVATIGIRGTGFYAQTDPARTYFCTCYGTVRMSALDDPGQTEQVTATHHDAARYILAQPDNGRRIVPAPFINHTDLELMTIEAIVGREVPFGLPDAQYEAPRRVY